MKVLKRVGIGIVAILALALIASFLMPKNYHLERSIVIAAEPEQLFPYVNSLPNWERWSYWHRLDPGQKLAYSQNPTGINAWYTWNGTINKTGKVTILKSEANKSMVYEMIFDEMEPNKAGFVFEPVNGGTKAIMSMDYDLSPPVNLFGGIMKGMIETQFDACLKNMDSVAVYDRSVVK
jgi:hypothetical protein